MEFSSVKRAFVFLFCILLFACCSMAVAEEAKQSLVDVSVNMVMTLEENETCFVRGGEAIVVTASAESGVAFVGYYFSDDNGNTDIQDIDGETLAIVVPEGEPGTKRILYVEAVAKDDDGSENTLTKTGWIAYNLEYYA